MIPKPARASPVTARPGCAGSSPVQRTVPWGPPSQVHGILTAQGCPRSVCAPFGHSPSQGAEISWLAAQPSSTRLQARSRPVQLTTQRNSWKPGHSCVCVGSGASSKDHSSWAAGSTMGKACKVEVWGVTVGSAELPHKLRSGPSTGTGSHLTSVAQRLLTCCSFIYRTRVGARPEGPYPGPPTRVQEGCRPAGVPAQRLLAPGRPWPGRR